jgi:uncharacterized membrane protein
MDFTKIGGLPTHPLLVHIPVVLVPLVTIAAVLMAVRKAWVERYGLVVLILGFVAAAGTAIASQAGEGLRSLVKDTATVRTHVNLAEQTKVLVGAFFLVLLAWVAIDWSTRRATSGRPVVGVTLPVAVTKAAVVLPVICVLFGLAASVWVMRTGHEGAKATWQQRELVRQG